MRTHVVSSRLVLLLAGSHVTAVPASAQRIPDLNELATRPADRAGDSSAKGRDCSGAGVGSPRVERREQCVGGKDARERGVHRGAFRHDSRDPRSVFVRT